MPRGRRPGPGTAEEKAAVRRERVRLNVQAFRKRKSGAASNPDASTRSTLRWVSDSKWQTEYDDQQRQTEDTADAGAATPSQRTSSTSSPEPESPDVDSLELCILPLLKSPDPFRQYSYAMLASVPARFLPYRVSIPSVPRGFISIRTPCALWVVSACNLAQTQESGPLKDSLLSIVVALAGKEQRRPDLSVVSQRLYARGLAKTRRSLQPIIEGKEIPAGTDLVGLFLSCHAWSVFELLINRSLEDMARHVQGISLLIQHLQRQSKISGLNSVIGDSLLEEYRMFQMNYCLMHRQPSTIYLDRLNSDSPATKRSKGLSIFTDLLDLADQVASIMAEMDKLRPKQKTNPAFCAEHLRRILHSLLNIHSQLKSWCGILREKLVEHSYGVMFAPAGFPIDPMQITSYEFAATWMFACSYDCYAVETCIEAFEFLADVNRDSPGEKKPTLPSSRVDILRSEQIATAGGIAEIQPYFMQDDKGIIGRSIAIWPLEAAWSTLENEFKRLERDELELERTDAHPELKLKLGANKDKVKKFLKVCRETQMVVKGYGLPVFVDRGQVGADALL